MASLISAGIPVVLLKGAALAETIYGNPAVRPMADLDLLVSRDHAARAWERLADEGYQMVLPEVRPGATLAYENELVLHKPGSAEPPIELHWHLLDSPFHQQTLDMTWFWETAAPLRVGHAAVLGLGTEAMLLHLCAHLALHHHGEGLKWWLDIAEIIRARGDGLAWSDLLDRAEAAGLVLPLQQVLVPLAEAWGVSIPRPVLARLSVMAPSANELRIHAALTQPDRRVAGRFWSDLGGLREWQARLRFAWINMLPSSQYMLDRYRPRWRWLLPFLYPYRWWVGLFGEPPNNPFTQTGSSESGFDAD